MEKRYLFKIVKKYQKGKWCRVEIKDNQSLGDLDLVIREAFNHDPFDHLSMFFLGRAWKSKDLGQIEPEGTGEGSAKLIHQLNLTEGDLIEYIYDFGDNIQYQIILEKTREVNDNFHAPCIIARSRTNHKYCMSCKSRGKKVNANWKCIEQLEDDEKILYLCNDCLEEKEDELDDIEELLY